MFKLVKSHKKREVKYMGMKCRSINYVDNRIAGVTGIKVLKKSNLKH